LVVAGWVADAFALPDVAVRGVRPRENTVRNLEAVGYWVLPVPDETVGVGVPAEDGVDEDVDVPLAVDGDTGGTLPFCAATSVAAAWVYATNAPRPSAWVRGR